MATMAGAAGNGPPPPQPLGGPSRIPQDKIYTEYELAMVKAAMMEELGIGRKEALPLEDRKGGVRDDKLKPVTKKTGNDDRKAAWWNFGDTVDDVNPNQDVEDIAGGQLYRMRRAAEEAERRELGLPPLGDNNSFRGGRGSRGGRGGYSSNTVRGGLSRGDSNRGAHTGPSSSLRGHGGTNHGSSSGSQVFFNDARRGGTHAHPQAEAIIARIRSVNTPTPATRGGLGGRSISVVARQVLQGPLRKQSPTKTTTATTATSAWGKGLATAQDGKFMTWGVNTLKPTPGPATSSPSQVGPHFVVSTQATSENNQVSTGEKTGLANSQWATDRSSNLSTQMASTSTPSTSSMSAKEAPSTHNTTPADPLVQHLSKGQTPIDNNYDPTTPLLREQVTKVTKNSEKTMIGKARIFNYTRANQLLTLQLEQQSTTVLTEEVSDEAAWIISARNLVIIYQASKDSPKWTIQFQFPGFAQRFYDVVATPRKARGIPIQTRNPFENFPNSLENAAPPPEVSAPGPAAQHSPPALSQSASSYYENDTRTSIRTHNDDMNEVGGIENLIDVGDTPHMVEDIQTLEFLAKLIEAMGEDFLVKAFSELTEQGGNVLNQISNIVILSNGTPTTSLSSNDIMASSQYVEASSKLLGTWLDRSALFQTFPDVWTLRFVEDKAPRILKRAVDERRAQENTRVVDESNKQDEKTEDSGNAQVNDQHLSDRTVTSTNENQKSMESHGKAMAEQSVFLRTHVISQKSYLIDDLLGFRDNGVAPQFDTLSKDVLHLFPSGATSKEKAVIKTTRTDVPILGDLSELSLTSGVTIHPITRDSQHLTTLPVETQMITGESKLHAQVWNTPSTEIAEPVITKGKILSLSDIASKAVKKESSVLVRKIVPELVQTDEKEDTHVEVQEIITPKELFIKNSTSKDDFTAVSKDATDISSAGKVTQSQGLSRELSVETHKTETAIVPQADTIPRKENKFESAEVKTAVNGSKGGVTAISENVVSALPISLKVESSSKEIKTTTSAEYTHLIGARDLPKPSSSNPKVGLSGSRWAAPGVLPAPVARSSSGTPVRPTAPEFRPNPSSPAQHSAPTPSGHHRSITSVSAQASSINRSYSDESVPELKKGVHNSKWANVDVVNTSSSRTSYSPVISASTALSHSHMAPSEVLGSYATVMEIDPKTGLARSVTGPVISTGTVPMMAMVPTQGSLALQENANWQFLARSSMHHHHSSSGSSMKSPKGTGSTYEPRCAPEVATSSQPRSALSPIHQGEKSAQVQARAQARLNASFSERSDIAANHKPWY